MSKVLIVEDREENIAAASTFFGDIGIELEIAMSIEEAIEKLEDDFLAVIIDVELPRARGASPEPIGMEVGEVAKNLYLPYVFLTGGTGGHTDSSYLAIDTTRTWENMFKNGLAKEYPQAWKGAWKFLTEVDLERNLESRLRYRQSVGKQFRKSEVFP